MDFRNPAIVKLSVLCEGVAFDPSATVTIGTRHAENKTVYNDGNQRLAPGVHAVPSEILLPDDLVCAVRYRPNSRWTIRRDGERFGLECDGRAICAVVVPERPAYYGMAMDGGGVVDQFVTQYSHAALGIFVRRSCVFWDQRLPCKFCSIEPVRRREGTFEPQLTAPTVLEAVRKAVAADPRVRYLEWCSGTYEDLNEGFLAIADMADAVARELPRTIKQHALLMPPADLALIARLAIMDQPTFAMEIWDEHLFEEVCPGKHKYYGRAGFLAALTHGVKLLGSGRMTCNFVAGLEPADGLIDGFHRLAERGIVPTVSVFHPDLGTAYAGRKPPTIEFMLPIVAALKAVYRRYGFRPFLLGSRRNSVDCEVYRGYF
jgi:hypothetical protein